MIICKRCGFTVWGGTSPGKSVYLEKCEACKDKSSLSLFWLRLRLCLANWRWDLAQMSVSFEDNDFKALALLERFETDYTLHWLDGVYYCDIGPEYGMEMQIMSAEAEGTGASLSLAIHNAIQDLGSKRLAGS